MTNPHVYFLGFQLSDIDLQKSKETFLDKIKNETLQRQMMHEKVMENLFDVFFWLLLLLTVMVYV